MSFEQRESQLIDLDRAFKLFGAVGMIIGIVLAVGVIALSAPSVGIVTTSPVVAGTGVSLVVLFAFAYLVSLTNQQR